VTYYVGILDGSKDVWGVRIPDVPGCYGGGATPEAAMADATSALREVAAHWATKGIELKPPRSTLEVMNDASAGYDRDAGESLVMVPLLLDQARSVKANVSLDAGLLEAIDEEAKLHGLTRSSYLASAALDKIVHRAANKEQYWSGLADEARLHAEQMTNATAKREMLKVAAAYRLLANAERTARKRA
jgi:predicted RNase H-like HicB family nuclease